MDSLGAFAGIGLMLLINKFYDELKVKEFNSEGEI
jgi:hypothetical protein